MSAANMITIVSRAGGLVSVPFKSNPSPFDLSLVWGFLIMKVEEKFNPRDNLTIFISVDYAIREFDPNKYSDDLKIHDQLYREINEIQGVIQQANPYIPRPIFNH